MEEARKKKWQARSAWAATALSLHRCRTIESYTALLIIINPTVMAIFTIFIIVTVIITMVTVVKVMIANVITKTLETTLETTVTVTPIIL